MSFKESWNEKCSRYKLVFLFLISIGNPIFSQRNRSLETNLSLYVNSLDLFGTINDSIHLSDSSCVLQLSNKTDYLVESFYGSGYGNGIMLHLIASEGKRFKVKDSVFITWMNDLVKLNCIQRVRNTPFFILNTTEDGAGYFAKINYMYSIINDKLVEVFSFPTYASMIDIEDSKKATYSVSIEQLSCTSTEIILKAVIEVGILEGEVFKPNLSYSDTAKFRMENANDTFLFLSNEAKRFTSFWQNNMLIDALMVALNASSIEMK